MSAASPTTTERSLFGPLSIALGWTILSAAIGYRFGWWLLAAGLGFGICLAGAINTLAGWAEVYFLTSTGGEGSPQQPETQRRAVR